ncbi:ABC transporter permease [Marinilabiliaceae bacterium N1Y90]|nr:ABC transporter permease [Marinilabiliaceae bacterium N1Y90]
MNFELFVARKIRTGTIGGKKLSEPVIKVATLSIILGMVVMILSLAIGFGFQREIKAKIVGFGSNIQITSYDYNSSYESNPITIDSSLIDELKQCEGVTHIQSYATKPGVIQTNEAIQAIVLKGTNHDYDWTFLKSILSEGEIPQLTDSVRSLDILISSEMARLLKLKVGDPVRMYFMQNNIRQRKFYVSGIYNSHFPEYDKVFAFIDIRVIQRLNKWDQNQVAGYEVSIDNFNNLDDIAQDIHYISSSKIEEDGTILRTKTIRQTQAQIFGWLDLMDTNLWVILILILVVAGFNMVSGLLILILERVNMIGIFKALGAENWKLRKVFLYLASYIVGRGLLWGNLIGVLICLLQKYTHFIKLDPNNYYLETVPIYITAWHLVLLNVGVGLITVLMLVGPSFLVTRILPVKAIRFN